MASNADRDVVVPCGDISESKNTGILDVERNKVRL